MRLFFLMLLALVAIGAPVASWAQPGPLIIDKSRPDRMPATAEPGPPSPTGPGGVKATPDAFTPFILREVRVQGSTAAPDAVGAASKAYIGQTVTAADLTKIADAIGAVYAASDIALYTVLLPRQSFENGVVRIVVIEGYIGDVTVTSDDPKADVSLIAAYGEKLKGEKPLHRSTLQRYIGLMRDVPGAKLDVQLLQGASPGAVRLALKVTPKRYETTMGINNRGSAYLGRTQVETSASVNGLFRQGERTRLTVAFPTDIERFRYVSLAHTEPLGENGATLNLSVGNLRTKPKIEGLSLKGDATTAGVQVSHPLIRSDTKNLFLTGGLDGLNSDNALFGQQISSERTRVIRLAAAYGFQAPKRAGSASIAVSQGLNGLGSRMADPLVDAAFTKANLQASVNQEVAPRVILRVAAAAQVSGKRLPASEQFTYGGAQFGRAFPSAVASGDSGVAGSVEVAWRPAKGLPKAVAGSEVYGFVDAGHVKMSAWGPYRSQSYNLASGGAGVRVAMTGKAVLELEAAKALKDPTGSNKSWMLMASVRSAF